MDIAITFVWLSIAGLVVYDAYQEAQSKHKKPVKRRKPKG